MEWLRHTVRVVAATAGVLWAAAVGLVVGVDGAVVRLGWVAAMAVWAVCAVCTLVTLAGMCQTVWGTVRAATRG